MQAKSITYAIRAGFARVLLALILAGCGGGDPEDQPAERTDPPPPPTDICGPNRVHCL
jgi:hypothetical protein